VASARIAITSVLHTWGSALTHHPHIHCIVPGGGIALDGSRWIAKRPDFLLPVRVLSKLFRRRMIEKLIAAHAAGQLTFYGAHAVLGDADALGGQVLDHLGDHVVVAGLLHVGHHDGLGVVLGRGAAQAHLLRRPQAQQLVAARLGAKLLQIGRDFHVERADTDWTWRRGEQLRAALPHPSLRGDYQLGNAACALTALDYLAERMPYAHAVWHLFVLGGCVSHFVAAYALLLGAPAGA